MRFSVIIASYNSEATIVQCLESLTKQETEDDYEVIVVDSSDDHTPQLIRNTFPAFRLLKLRTRTFQGPARNLGVQEAKAEILVFMDADCTAPANWLSTIAQVHESEYAIVCGAVRNGHPFSRVSWTEYFFAAPGYSIHSPRRSVSVAPACNMSCKRDAFDKCGRFSETYRLEDVLFSHRASQEGFRILFDPSIYVHHLYRVSLKELVRREILCGRLLRWTSSRTAIRGSALFRNRVLSLAFPLIKLGLTSLRVWRWERSEFGLFMEVLPAFFALSLATTWGLVIGGGATHG